MFVNGPAVKPSCMLASFVLCCCFICADNMHTLTHTLTLQHSLIMQAHADDFINRCGLAPMMQKPAYNTGGFIFTNAGDHIINTHPRWHPNSKQLYSKYACLIDVYEYSTGNEVMQCRQTILYSKHCVFSWVLIQIYEGKIYSVNAFVLSEL